MRVFVTGATGFIGGHVVKELRARGDEVVALVRDPTKAVQLANLGCGLVTGDLGSTEALKAAMSGCDRVIHGAAIYRVGIMPKDRPAMYAANVVGTQNVMAAALEAKVEKIVYLSSCATFGDTRGQVVDEGFAGERRFGSYYDETKHLAHQAVERLIAERKLPCVIVMPGVVYGPNDPSDNAVTLRKFLDGKLPVKVFPKLGILMTHVEDIAHGVVLALDLGKVGESYVLGGERMTQGEVFDGLARLVGRKPPRLAAPTWLLKAVAPLGPLTAALTGFPPNLGETIRIGQSTYWASDAKARRELGYQPRPFEVGMRQTLEAEGRLR